MGAIVPQLAAATASSGGTATFKFPAPPQGLIWAGTVSVPGAPAAGIGMVQLSGTTIGKVLGSSPAGPYTAMQGQVLSVVMAGLTPATQYQAVWIVDTDSPGQVPGPVSSVTAIINEPGSTVVVSNTDITPLFTIPPPTPPYELVTSTSVTMTGSPIQLTDQALAYGLILLSCGRPGNPIVANTAPIYISDHGDVSTGSAFIGPGQGIVIPIANASGIDVLGTAPDVLSYWGA